MILTITNIPACYITPFLRSLNKDVCAEPDTKSHYDNTSLYYARNRGSVWLRGTMEKYLSYPPPEEVVVEWEGL